jgi:hypothetical protein
VANLAAALGARTARTPPESLRSLRPLFDGLDEPITRAFYTCGNYTAAEELKTGSFTFEQTSGMTDRSEIDTVALARTTSGLPQVTIVDRFYHSTCAYTVGAATKTVDGVHRLDEEVFQWPVDLPWPALVLLLDMDDDKRMARIRARGPTGWAATEEVNIIFFRLFIYFGIKSDLAIQLESYEFHNGYLQVTLR